MVDNASSCPMAQKVKPLVLALAPIHDRRMQPCAAASNYRTLKTTDNEGQLYTPGQQIAECRPPRALRAEASGNNGTHCRPTKNQATQQGSAQHRKCPARPLCHCRRHTKSHVRQMPVTHRQQQRDILAAHTPRLTREQELRHPAHNQRHHKHRTTQTRLHIPRHRRHAPLTPEKYAKRQACTAKHSAQQRVKRQPVRHGFMLTYRATFYKVKRPRLPPPRSPDFNTAN